MAHGLGWFFVWLWIFHTVFGLKFLGDLGPFFFWFLFLAFTFLSHFSSKEKRDPKRTAGGGTGRFPVLVWFSPGNRPPFRPLSEYGGPEGLLGSGFEFLRWRFCCGRGVCKWGVLRWMWFSFFRLGDWPAFLVGFLSFDFDLWGFCLFSLHFCEKSRTVRVSVKCKIKSKKGVCL